MNTGRCSEELLHGYADGRLSATEHARVEAWLAVHPEDRERVAAWRANDELLRRAYDAAVAGPIPERLLQAAGRPRAPGLRIAAALGWLALGLAGGYALRDLTAPPAIDRIASLPHDAAVAHAVYAPEVRHPVEVGADQEAHLVAWLSKRLGAELKVPALDGAGYRLVGGRLLPGEAAPVAQFMYQDGAGRRLTLYVRRDAADTGATAFRYADEGRLGVFYWIDGKFGYALSAELPREALLPLASLIYGQLNP
jgi:anti-sigma factor RsiW